MALKIYSKPCEYAIRALSAVQNKRGAEIFSLKDACRKAGVHEPITRKSFQALVRAGILSAKQGPGGGYRFLCSPDRVTILDIVEAVDGSLPYDVCVLGRPECSSHNPCALHSLWTSAKETLLSELSSKTLQTLSIHQKKRRSKP